jgi:hypothetical protein
LLLLQHSKPINPSIPGDAMPKYWKTSIVRIGEDMKARRKLFAEHDWQIEYPR